MEVLQSCEYCQENFPSKTKLFKHLGQYHGVESKSSLLVRPRKAVILVGWLSEEWSYNEEEKWLGDNNIDNAMKICSDRSIYTILNQK